MEAIDDSRPVLLDAARPSSHVDLSDERLATSATARRHPVHRWFNFIAGFSPEFVDACCRNLSGGDVLLDPFAGCGTAPLAAALCGLDAIGFEPHPFFARIARAKLTAPGAIDRIEQIDAVLRRGLAEPRPVSSLAVAPQRFLGKLFDRNSLEALLGARAALKESPLRDDDLAFLVLSSMLERTTHTQTDGIYKAPGSTKTAATPREACDAVVEQIRADLRGLDCAAACGRARIVPHSSEDMSAVADSSVSVVVTSPPYLNNFDYAEMTRMPLYFWGMAESWGEITRRVRARLVVNTTTALAGHKNKLDGYRQRMPGAVRPALDALTAALAQRRSQRAGKKVYDRLVYPYFHQMTCILRESLRCLRRGAWFHMMIADSALYGVHVRTHELLGSIMEDVGYRDVACRLVRQRGHRWILDKREGTPDGLGEYHVTARKP